MSEPEAFRICPYCGSTEIPKLIVQSARLSPSGSSWRCRACDHAWSDSDHRLLEAS